MLTRILLWIAAALVVIASVAFLVLRSDRFEDFVRRRIVAYVEDSTGGRVELKVFNFRWNTRTATARGFIIHGREPSTSPPFFSADSITVRLRLLPSFHQAVDLEYFGVDRPVANIFVMDNGETNIPIPRTKPKPGDKSSLETIIDLAVHRIEVSDGAIQFEDRKVPVNLHGRDFRIAMAYDLARTQYQGELSMALEAVYGTPVNARLDIPLVLRRDAVVISNAKLQTAESTLLANIVVRDIASPKATLEATTHISLDEISRAGLPIHADRSLPRFLDARIALESDHEGVAIRSASLVLGNTHLEAAGAGNRRANLQGVVVLAELARLLAQPNWPEGTVHITATADLAANYSLAGTLSAPDLRVRTAGAGKVQLASTFRATPQALDIGSLSLRWLDGEITASGGVTDWQRVHATAELHHFSIQAIGHALASKPVDYSGIIGGTITAQGSLTAPDIQTAINISPGRTGVPVAGRVAALYRGAECSVSIATSVITLPNSRLEITGQPGREAKLQFVSRNLRDLAPAIKMLSSQPGELPAALNGGSATLTVTERGPLTSPQLSGQVQATNFSVTGRQFDALSATFAASASGVEVTNGGLTRAKSRVGFQGSAGLDHWRLQPEKAVSLNLSVQDGDVADFLALAGETGISASGAINAVATINGSIGNPQGAVNITAGPGRVFDDSFDRVQLLADLTDRLVTLKTLEASAGAARLQVHGSFTHPRNDFATGTMQAQISSSGVELNQFKTLQEKAPGLSGLIEVNGEVAGDLNSGQSGMTFMPTSVNGNLQATHIQDQRRNYGDLSAIAQTTASVVTLSVKSNFVGSSIQLSGTAHLSKELPIAADFSVKDLAIDKALSAVSVQSISATGNASLNGRISGTMRNPQATLRLGLTNANIETERIDQLAAEISYTDTVLNLASFQLRTPAGQVTSSGTFSHPASRFDAGNIGLHLEIPGAQFQRIQHIHDREPGFDGRLQTTADFSAEVRRENGQIKILPISANAKGALQNLSLNGKSLGGANFEARTQGTSLTLDLNSDLAKSAIHGSGSVQLQNNYPADLKLSFSNVTYAGLKGVTSAPPAPFDAVVEGSASFNGPLSDFQTGNGEVLLSRLEVSRVKDLVLKNQGPVTVRLNGGQLHLENARIIGPSTDIAVSGTAGLTKTTALDLTVKAKTDLRVIKIVESDAVASGTLDLNSTIRGTLAKPNVTGRVQLNNASLQLADWPNGLYNANGSILLNGTSGSIQTLTAESGGGKINISGFFSYNGSSLNYDIRANARQVRTRYAGASITASAALTLSGSSSNGILNGTVTIARVGYGQQSDIGSILSASTTPPQAASASGPLSSIRTHVRIETAPDVQFQTTLAQQLSATANLTLLGSLENPGMVGRVNVTGGTLVFFSNKYAVNRGSIAFYDVNSVQPVLDIDLETSVQGVDVDLTISGPMDNLKLTYRSDPPLRFEDIIALLAAGKTPPDPTVAVNQPAAPDQSAMQMGESALVGQAVANPIANQLQRVFGITQLNIAPTFVSGTALPQARITLQQQVASSVTFTYSQDLSQTNSQLIRVEWALTPRFSAVATRDENGIFGVDFYYKKQFH